MLDIEAIQDQDCFIPHMTMTTFAQTAAKLSGEEHFGVSRPIQRTGSMRSHSVLGGLHHHYVRI
jgi:hypothetical protein